MLFNELVSTSRLISSSRSRLQKTAHLADLLRRLSDEERRIGVGYLMGKLRQGRIGVGGAALRALNDVPPAAEARLRIVDVDAAISELTGIGGAGSAAKRTQSLRTLFSQATQEEQAFLFRLMLGELRQGALEGIMVDAIAKAATVPSDEVRRALMFAGDAAVVAERALAQGAAGLKEFGIRLFQPVKPMLAQPADTASAAVTALGTAALEYKLDGARVQVHKDGEEVRIYSRRLNDVTIAVPEIVGAILSFPARTLILDGETLAIKPDGTPHSFQTTMRRFGRKLDIDALRHELPLKTLFFDCLHVDGEDLIDHSGAERAAVMQRVLPPDFIMPRIVTDQPAAAEQFMTEALRCGHEGIMAKSLSAPYEAGNRGSSWLKIKFAHTLDLVILAAEWGNGRRQGWLSNLHLGARDPENGNFVMLGKTFKGLTDQMLAWQTQRLQELQIATDGYTVYVRPELVVEITFNDLQQSPQYPGGLALRFARVKQYRPDKRAEDADTMDTIRALYARQGATIGDDGEPA